MTPSPPFHMQSTLPNVDNADPAEAAGIIVVVEVAEIITEAANNNSNLQQRIKTKINLHQDGQPPGMLMGPHRTHVLTIIRTGDLLTIVLTH